MNQAEGMLRVGMIFACALLTFEAQPQAYAAMFAFWFCTHILCQSRMLGLMPVACAHEVV